MRKTILFALSLSAAISQAQLYGVGPSNSGAGYDFHQINTSTGLATPLFNFNVPGSTSVNHLTYVPTTNKFLTVAAMTPFFTQLIELDLGAQTATIVGTGIPINSMGTPYFEGLEYMASQGGIVISHGPGGFFTGQLALLNPLGYGMLNTTGALLNDGDTVFMDGTGALNVLDSNNPTGGFMRNRVTGLFGTNTLTGFGLNMFAAGDTDLAWKADEGRLFLTQGNFLSEVNAASTVITPIGQYGAPGSTQTITGLAAVPVPEPASFIAVGAGAILLMRRKRRG